MIRVFIIDDHPVVRKGVRGLLEEFQDIQIGLQILSMSQIELGWRRHWRIYQLSCGSG